MKKSTWSFLWKLFVAAFLIFGAVMIFRLWSQGGIARGSINFANSLAEVQDEEFDYLIVGAGFSGSIFAERLASQNGKRSLVIEKRDHIAGNCFDAYNEYGVLYHVYGPHCFHTTRDHVWDYLSKFTKWRMWALKVFSVIQGQLINIPVNRNTINLLFQAGLKTDEDTKNWFASHVRAPPSGEPQNSEEAAIASIGPELYELMFKGYTCKQWDMCPDKLDPSVIRRIPYRTNTKDGYFNDKHQAIPAEGYTRMFENMLTHPKITVMLNTDFFEVRNKLKFKKVIFTGPIDRYFDEQFGKLQYRSLYFNYVTLETTPEGTHHPVAQINYPNDHNFTRITEMKHASGQIVPYTTLAYEYPTWDGEPYYPVPNPANRDVYAKYAELAKKISDKVLFVGRLADYKYYNMEDAVHRALEAYKAHARTL
eukprot:gnl/Trimastix_PCT/943.p1 GENE.gnl/Trimastix_PCT/943~~gnl/Trimastix_PCT/943.p1  ORF type:complete len:423 (-),score=142.58 gnl/Trimastix_PCT/943:23-1291(-)